jgi:hypothetical protein
MTCSYRYDAMRKAGGYDVVHRVERGVIQATGRALPGRGFDTALAAVPTGDDAVSFNLCRLSSGEGSLRPCEMPAAKVIAFVLGYGPDGPGN